MFSWLARKNENARVYMCTKEVKWDLENSSILRKGKILALAQILRSKLFREIDFDQRIIDKPLNFPRKELMMMYCLIENIRNKSNLERERLGRVSRKISHPMPAFVTDHMKASVRGLEVWMCTLGAGVSPNLRDEVRAIWNHLAQGFNVLNEVVDSLREYDLLSAELLGHTDAMQFSNISYDEWHEICSFQPSAFSESIYGDGSRTKENCTSKSEAQVDNLEYVEIPEFTRNMIIFSLEMLNIKSFIIDEKHIAIELVFKNELLLCIIVVYEIVKRKFFAKEDYVVISVLKYDEAGEKMTGPYLKEKIKPAKAMYDIEFSAQFSGNVVAMSRAVADILDGGECLSINSSAK